MEKRFLYHENLRLLPRSLTSSHIISPPWVTWEFCLLFLVCCHHTSLSDSGHSGQLLSWKWARVNHSLSSQNPASAMVMFQPSSVWQDLQGRKLIWRKLVWRFTPKVALAGTDFHPLITFRDQAFYKNSICKRCLPTLAPLTYFYNTGKSSSYICCSWVIPKDMYNLCTYIHKTYNFFSSWKRRSPYPQLRACEYYWD